MNKKILVNVKLNKKILLNVKSNKKIVKDLNVILNIRVRTMYMKD